MNTTEPDIAQRRANMPSGAHRVLDRRSLEHGNKNLLPLLKTGMNVLDVGCGSGSITSGIAKCAQPGTTIGLDPSEELIAMATQKFASQSNLAFVKGDVFQYEGPVKFDLITTARTLQWLSKPEEAIIRMKSMLSNEGTLAVLDYNHEKIEWEPAPPPSMLRFYDAFLKWRNAAGLHNRIADEVHTFFATAGLRSIQVSDESEFSHRSDADFLQAAGIWKVVAETRGIQIVKDGYITETERLAAIEEYDHWLNTEAVSMKMYLLAIAGQN